MRSRAIAIAVTAALLPGFLVAWSLSRELPRFFDPCFQWGSESRFSRSIAPDSPCRSVGGTSETKAEAIARTAVVHGGIPIAGLLGVAGVLAGRPLLSVLGAALMFLEAVPLMFSFAWLAVFAAGLILTAAREIPGYRGAASTGARIIGSLAALAALLSAPSLARGAPLFFVFLLFAFAFVAFAAWRPRADAEAES